MDDQPPRPSNLFCLLIGIDHYLPNSLPGGISYRNLGGCVRDVAHVETFLRTKLGVPDDRIFKLTAPVGGAAEPPTLRDRQPTYENMVRSFQRLGDVAQPGDHVYIHYCGHGGRPKTIFPELKGEDGFDESLVPTDIGNSATRYLRDVELAKLLKELVDKQLVLTLTLDSCHSGGATRGATVRGIGVVDNLPRPTDSLVASHAELTASWLDLTAGGQTRNLSLGSGWLPEPRGYVLLAACRSSESAYEFPFDGRQSNGALTYWLLDSLQAISPNLTYKQVHDRIVAKVHSQFENQTPQLQGEGDRIVFGSGRSRSQYAVTVMRVDDAQRRVLLSTGQAQGMRRDAQFAIYATGANDFTQLERRVALAKITQLGATESWAEYETLRPGPIEQGAQAILINPGSVKLVRKVRLLADGGTTAAAGVDRKNALAAVEQDMERGGWVEAAKGVEPSEYQVTVNEHGEYEILDRAGVPIKRLRPPIRAGEAGAGAKVVARLVHLARYHVTLELDNNDPLSPLAGKLSVELTGVQKEYDPADKPEPAPFNAPGNTPTITAGHWTFLHIKNNSAQVVNVVVLDLQPDWGITQVYPAGQDWFAPFDPGQEITIPLQANLPCGYEEGTDVLKVIAAHGAANFHWLELPPLDQPLQPRSGTRGANHDPLAELLEAITAEKPPTRNLTPAAYPSREWVTEQVEVRVKRS